MTTGLQQDCATTVHEKKWCAASVLFTPSRRFSKRLIFWQTDDVCHESQVQVEFQTLLGSHFDSVIILNLVENSQCSESLEFFPLELHRLPVDPIQIFEIPCFQKPFDPVFPSFDWFITDASQAQQRARKDVGFGSRKLNSSVSSQSSLFPHRLLPVNRGQSGSFCLIRDQPLSHLK